MSAEHKRGVSTSEIILPREVQSLPLVCQKGVRGVLERLQRMEEMKDWSDKARTIEELNGIIPQIEKDARNLTKRVRTFSSVGDFFSRTMIRMGMREEHSWNWGYALDIGWGAVDTAVRRTGRRRAFEAAGRAGYISVCHDIRDIEWYGFRAAAWETVRDQRRLGRNPYVPLIALYELGAVRYNFQRVNEHVKLVVDFPLKVDGELALGCWAFGDSEILYHHGLKDISCKNIQPLKPPLKTKRIMSYA